ncbi:MAG: hypothetical protein ABI162_06185 [Luteolibacter sp.]
MSKAFDHFEFEPEIQPPFWKPFVFAILFGLPASALWQYLAVHQGLRVPGFSLAIGGLCGLGARKGEGDYLPAFLGTFVLLTVTLLLNTLILTANEIGTTPWELLVEVMLRGKATAFLNQGLMLVGSSSRSYSAIPIAFYVAYKAQRRD